jgi:hypothetical protein
MRYPISTVYQYLFYSNADPDPTFPSYADPNYSTGITDVHHFNPSFHSSISISILSLRTSVVCALGAPLLHFTAPELRL